MVSALFFGAAHLANPAATLWSSSAIAISAGLLLALVGEFGIAPRIIARENLKVWHALGSGAYLVQWACAATVLWRVLRPPPA